MRGYDGRMPSLTDLGPGGLYALGLLRKQSPASLADLQEAASPHRIDRGELLSGLRELERHGFAREDGGSWTLTAAGRQLEGGWHGT